jgi:TolB protein
MMMMFLQKFMYRFGIVQKSMLAMLIAALCFGMASLAVAQTERITITEGTIEPTPIAIADFTDQTGTPGVLGRVIAEVISNDLDGSGMFRPEASASLIPPPATPSIKPDFSEWTPLGVKALLVGSAVEDENGMIEVVFILWDVVTEREIIAGEGQVSEAGLRRISHQIADLVFESWTGDRGYFDTRIVYVAESGPAEKRVKRLAIMDQDGHNHTYLTNGSSLVLTPRFSPQVQEIAYLDYFNDNPNVYLLDIQSAKSELLGSFPGMSFAPRFSYDGKSLIMSLARSGVTNIFVMDLSTRQTKQLTNTPFIDTSPSFSPDDKQIVFNSDRSGSQQLYVMNRDGSNVRRISRGKGRYATPVWSPRGDIVAFTKMYKGEFYIGVMNSDGSGERLLAKGFLVEGPTWAPNGRVLMYFKQNPTNSDGSGGESYLYRIDITGFNERRIITPEGASDPAWSPFLP